MSADHQAVLREAVALHQAGRLDEAEAKYRLVLAATGAKAGVLNLLGAVAHARGQFAAAIDRFTQALAADPRLAGAYYNRALAYEAVNRPEDAAADYRRALEINPAFADACLNLAVLERQQGNLAQAIDCLRGFVAAHPRDARGHYNLGRCLAEAGRGAEALPALESALRLDPRYADALLTKANVLAATGRLDDAIAAVRAAVTIAPDRADYWTTLGMWLSQSGDHAAALAAHRKACALAPADARILANHGAALIAADRVDAAIAVLTQATAADPDNAEALYNLALAHDQIGQTRDAITALETALLRRGADALTHQSLSVFFSNLGWRYAADLHLDRARALAPGDPLIAFSDALRQLRRGNLAEGWTAFERRFDLWAVPRYRQKGVARRAAPPPYWDGQDLAGKSIAVWREQGLGDEIMLAGMIPELVARAARVVVRCSPRLVPVFARSFPAAMVVADDAPAPPADYQCAMGSLGRVLRARWSDFPPPRAYLRPEPARVAAFKARYGAGPRIGVSWHSKASRIGGRKSARLSDLAPVLTLPGASFVNLQYGDCAAELAEAQAHGGVTLLTDPEVDALRDMDGFVSQVAAMDLVITTSNTAAHVAGALGVATWVLLPLGEASLWYWFDGRDDSPWYPAVRLFRPTALEVGEGPWVAGPVRAVAERLREWLAARRIA
jgi:tetratricopeptide (TPR) repeat protein